MLGARQVGKTTLARSIGKNLNSIYLDLESPEDLLKLTDPLSFLSLHQDKLVILDEIQRVPDLFAVLRGLIDKNRERGRRAGQFLLLGSASMDLLRQSAESLAGRIRYIEMTGLNLLEVCNNGSEESQDTVRDSSAPVLRENNNGSVTVTPRQSPAPILLDNGDGTVKVIPTTLNPLQRLWLFGGFPDSYYADNESLAFDWLEDLIRTYLERDVPQMGFRVPAIRLRRLWTMLAHLQGETINYSKLAGNLEVDGKTVSHYIDILTDLLLVRRIEPWHQNVKKRLVKSPRFYVRDSGVLHRLLGIDNFETLLSNPVLGKSWEGFVIENIHSVLPRRSEAYFYRTSAGAEIDLVIKMPSSQIWAIEIKYGVAPKPSKHYSKTCDDVGASRKYIVYGGNDEFPVGEDVMMISLPRLMNKIQTA